MRGERIKSPRRDERKRKINGAVVSREFKDGKWENFFILNGTIYGGKTLVSDVEY